MTTPAFLQEVAYAVHEEITNKREPIVADRQAYPWWSFLLTRKKEHTFTQGKCVVKLQRDGGLEAEHWDGKQVLGFQENRVDVEMEFTPRRTHIGVEFVHTELEDEGYEVEPNGPRGGTGFAKRISKADVDRIMNIFEQRIEDMMDAWDTRLDVIFHRDGTQDALAPIGLDGLMPILNTAGTYGGQPRTDEMFRHHVATGSTVTAGGTLERDLQGLIRDAEVNNRGTPSKVDFIMAGWDWIDGYIAYARANDMPYERNGGTAAVKRVDIGLPDSAIHFNGIPVVHNPTAEALDRKGFYSGTTWSKRAYMLSSKTWVLGYQKGKLKKFSSPLDPGDQRLTRCSLDGRHVLYSTKINGNALNTIA
jgi:hypothetical protein